MRLRVERATHCAGQLIVPGDKSISHRALILAAIATNTCRLTHLAPGADVRATVNCLRALGVELAVDGDVTVVHGRGLAGLRPPTDVLDCGNSGTTMRLLAGVVAGAGITCVLDGDESLRRRPMRRILAPLRAMGARVTGVVRNGDETPPLRFAPAAPLVGCVHQLSIASAQVKSCLLLAGLWAAGTTTVVEPAASRDHTERMLVAMGAPLHVDHLRKSIRPLNSLQSPAKFTIPGDLSSAAFPIAAAILVPGGHVRVAGVGVNPTRTGFIDALRRMGAHIHVEPCDDQSGEPVADIEVREGGTLRAIEVEAAEVPRLVDEIPILAVVATQAHGTTVIRGAGELRVKESDRLHAMATHLARMGAKVDEFTDGLAITGPTPLRGASVDCRGDHRIALSFAIAGLVADGGVEIAGAEWVDVSYPGFFTMLSALTSFRKCSVDHPNTPQH